MLRFALLTSLVLAAGTTAQAADDKPPTFTRAGHTTDSLQVVKERVGKKKAVLVDVREQKEWDAGHLEAAKLVPLSRIRENTLTAEMKKGLPRDKPIYVHCKSGGRVLMVSEILRAKGYDIRPLRPGYEKLVEEGFKKAKPKTEQETKSKR